MQSGTEQQTFPASIECDKPTISAQEEAEHRTAIPNS